DNPEERLIELRNHEWFEGFAWGDLQTLKMTPPTLKPLTTGDASVEDDFLEWEPTELQLSSSSDDAWDRGDYSSKDSDKIKRKSVVLDTNVVEEMGDGMDEDCMRRYKHIKDAYLKNKRARKMITGASASSKPSKWYLVPFLNFLNTVSQERK
ncbi:MADF domain, partial [Cinara cedri]